MPDNTTTKPLPDLWDAEACEKWVSDTIEDQLTKTFHSYDSLTSRYCEACANAWFFDPKTPVECPGCKDRKEHPS